MNYNDNLIRIKKLESFPKLTKIENNELKLRKILHEDAQKIKVYMNNTSNYDEETQYLIYHCEIIIHMLKKYDYQNPELFC